MVNLKAERDGVQRMRAATVNTLNLANARVKEVGMQRKTVVTLKISKPSTYVLDLKNARVKGVAGTLGFAKLRVERGYTCKE